MKRRKPRKSESQKKKKRLRESWEYSGPKVRPKRSAKPVKHNDTETEEEEEKVPYRKRAPATKPAIISDPGEFLNLNSSLIKLLHQARVPVVQKSLSMESVLDAR